MEMIVPDSHLQSAERVAVHSDVLLPARRRRGRLRTLAFLGMMNGRDESSQRFTSEFCRLGICVRKNGNPDFQVRDHGDVGREPLHSTTVPYGDLIANALNLETNPPATLPIRIDPVRGVHLSQSAAAKDLTSLCGAVTELQRN